MLDRVRELGRAIKLDDDYEKLQRAGEVASAAINANHQNNDAEDLKHLEEDINAAKKILSDILQRNKQIIRREKFNSLRDSFNSYIRQFAEPQEIEQAEKFFERAETLIERDDSAFDDTLDEIRALGWRIIFTKDDDFVVRSFHSLTKDPDDYDDRATFYRLVQYGKNAIAQNNINELRRVVLNLYSISGHTGDELLTANILKG